MNEDFWRAVRMKERNSNKSRRTGALNIALLFGTAAIALTLILTPMLAGRSSVAIANAPSADPYDDIKTGSIRPVPDVNAKPETENGRRYVIRRSILQESPGSVCIVEGYKSGEGC
ncbi:hypothetical protein [Gellertiella hungarica]